MIRLRYIVLLAFSGWLLAPANAQLLYEISGNGCKQKSYMLATNRLVDMQFIDTIPNVFKCFGKCQKVVTEFAMQDYEAIAALRHAALLPDSIKLSNFYLLEECFHRTLLVVAKPLFEQFCPKHLRQVGGFHAA